jgi:hypothetical protein
MDQNPFAFMRRSKTLFFYFAEPDCLPPEENPGPAAGNAFYHQNYAALTIADGYNVE